MFTVLLAAALAEGVLLSRDDTYHRFKITNDSSTRTVFNVMPFGGHSAILVLLNKGITVKGVKREFKPGLAEGEGWQDLSGTHIERTTDWNETRFILSESVPMQFGLTCTHAEGPCMVSINHVHTDPVYRTSAVLGSFGLFLCLFLFVFSWTIFCGACRATRKR